MSFKSNKSHNIQLYGFHAVHEAWLNPEREIHEFLVTPQALNGFEQSLKAGKSKNLKRPAPQKVEKQKLEKILPRGAVHQGLAISCSPLPEMDAQDLIIANHDQDNTLLVMLDQVTDPHNVGAILRSASAFGAAGIILQKKHSPILDGVLAKTACGGLEHTPVAVETNLSRAIESLKDAGYFVYGLDERGARSLEEIQMSENSKISGLGKAVLILGAEGPGMRRLIQENCDELVRLPTKMPIASLNVSNAAAVALYALSVKK